jgi:mannose-1-phosphate guanylyltransferase
MSQSQNNHIEIAKEQLPELPDDQLIVEPSKRDTMPSILNAMQTISQKCSQTEAIISIHSDQYIEDSDNFIQDLKRGAELSENYARIVLMGMVPDKPGPKFGHITKLSHSRVKKIPLRSQALKKSQISN